MATVGTRELKQNPNAVLQRVIASGEPLDVTSHGHRTGVRLVIDSPEPRAWVRGAALLRVSDLDPGVAQRWHDDLAAIDDVVLDDPWAPRT